MVLFDYWKCGICQHEGDPVWRLPTGFQSTLRGDNIPITGKTGFPMCGKCGCKMTHHEHKFV